MTESLNLPPIFRALALEPGEAALPAAAAFAKDEGEPGRFLFSLSEERAEAAVVLAPEQPLGDALAVIYVAALAIGDALGSLIPPVVAVTFAWPDRILVNGAVAGGLAVARDPVSDDGPPDWLAIGLSLALRGSREEGEPGEARERTNLYEEGCGEAGGQVIIESYARHFLAWINRWQDDGFDPVKSAWLARTFELGETLSLSQNGEAHKGVFRGLDHHGGLILEDGEARVTLDLADALRQPSWSL